MAEIGPEKKHLPLNIPLGTNALLGREALGHTDSHDYVLWAVEQIVEGKDSLNLRILAGLEKPYNPFEIKKYFDGALQDLEISTHGKKCLIECYAREIAQFVIDAKTDLDQCLAVLYQICLDLNYDQKYMAWYDLGNGREAQLAGWDCFFEPLNNTEFGKLMIEEALELLKTLDEID